MPLATNALQKFLVDNRQPRPHLWYSRAGGGAVHSIKRRHIRNTIVGERYQDLVTAALKESKALKEFQAEVAREELQQAAKSQRNDLFQKLVDADRNLATLLTNRDPVISLPSAGKGDRGNDGGAEKYEGKRSPTFLRFGEKESQKTISVPINRTRSVIAKTDVENGYLQRADKACSV